MDDRPQDRERIPPVRQWTLDYWLITLFGLMLGALFALLALPDCPGWIAQYGAIPVVAVAGVIIFRQGRQREAQRQAEREQRRSVTGR